MTIKNRERLENHLRSGRFRIFIDAENNVSKVDCESMPNHYHMKKDVFKNMYSFFSLHAHPSYASLMQLEQAYKGTQWISMALSASMQFTAMLSVFTAGYCSIFAEVKDEFKKLPDGKRFAIDFYNECFRGVEFAIDPEDRQTLYERLRTEL